MQWLSLFLLALLMGATYFQAIQGVTSAAIMCALTTLSLALSFGTYEYVADSFLMNALPEYAYAIALMGMFIIPLIVLRVLSDILIPRANLLPQILDRVGAAVLGLCTSFLVIGMLAIAINMIPWGAQTAKGGGFLGYSRFNCDDPSTQNELWLKPDRVAASFGMALSDGVFSGARSFRAEHPNFMTDVGWMQSAPLGVRRTATAKAVSLVDAGKINYVYDLVGARNKQAGESNPEDPKSGHFFVRTTLQLGDDLADTDNRIRFTPASIRLIGELAGEPAIYSAIAVADPDDPNRYVKTWKKNRNTDKVVVAGQLFLVPSNKQVDVAFEVPEGFEPKYVIYKIGGKVPISKSQINASTGGSFDRTSASRRARPNPTPKPAGRGSGGGRVSGVKVIVGKSHFGDDLPLTMTSFQSYDVEENSGVLEQGHIYGHLDDQGKQGSKAISRLKVPSGKKLLHLNVENLRAGSVLGKALNWSVQTVENYTLEDDRGNKVTPVGKYAIANVGGRAYVEVQYFPDYIQSGGRIRPFNKIKRTHLKGDYQLVYLFLMEPGRKAIEFRTGSIKRPMDLRSLNLVAR